MKATGIFQVWRGRGRGRWGRVGLWKWQVKGVWVVVFGMLGWRQVTPRWADDPRWQQDVRWWMRRQGRSGMSLPDRNRTAGGEGVPCSINTLCNNKQQSLDLECSMYKVVTSTPHNSDKPHELVASNTHTHAHIPQTHVGDYSIICGTYKYLYLHHMGCIV